MSRVAGRGTSRSITRASCAPDHRRLRARTPRGHDGTNFASRLPRTQAVAAPGIGLHQEGALPARVGPPLVSNHVSVIAPVLVGAAAMRAGRIPRFAGTICLSRIPVVRAVLGYFAHIPLDRDAAGDATRLDPTQRAFLAQECL